VGGWLGVGGSVGTRGDATSESLAAAVAEVAAATGAAAEMAAAEVAAAEGALVGEEVVALVAAAALAAAHGVGRAPKRALASTAP
jgi:hypothetical protein